MEKRSDILVDEELLVKFFAGEAAPEEAMAIADWLEQSVQNQMLYNSMEDAWSLNQNNTKAAPSKEEAWKKLQAVLPKEEAKVIPFRFNYKVAAAVLIFLGAGLVAYYYSDIFTTSDELAWNSKQTLQSVESVSLNDGTNVTINRNSTLQWSQELTRSSRKGRKVRLTGEAFFDVAHDPESPFIVEAGEVQVKVLGTAFNVAETDTGTVAEVVRGKVMMFTSTQEIIIEAGMMGYYDSETKTLNLLKLKNENNIAYVTHILSFESARLKEVCEQLSKAYGVKFVLSEKVKECTLTSEYHDKSLTFILSVISESLSISYEIKGDTVYITGEGCL